MPSNESSPSPDVPPRGHELPMARASTMPKIDNRPQLQLGQVYPICRELAALVRQMRRSQGVTQKQLATAIGVSTSNINQLERGHFNFSVARLIDLAEALGIDPAWLLATAMQSLKEKQ